MSQIEAFNLLYQFIDEGDKYIQKYYPNLPQEQDINNSHNNFIDAFRHAYVSGRFVQTGHSVKGAILGSAREIFPLQPADEYEMDIINNAKGREFGEQCKTSDELAKRIIKAIENKELILKPNDSPSHKIFKSEISNKFIDLNIDKNSKIYHDISQLVSQQENYNSDNQDKLIQEYIVSHNKQIFQKSQNISEYISSEQQSKNKLGSKSA